MEAWFAFERKICRFLLLISGITLAVMLLFTVTDVLMRAFGKPILGGFEIISFLGAVVIGFALPYTSLYKGHVAVDFFLEIVPKNVSSWMQIATRILVIILFIFHPDKFRPDADENGYTGISHALLPDIIRAGVLLSDSVLHALFADCPDLGGPAWVKSRPA